MDESQDDQDHQAESRYLSFNEIDFKKTFEGLCSLSLLRDDMYLRMQAFNLQIVDQWTTELEYQVLKEYFEKEKTPKEAFFLNAQSQMWIMAVYEVLRTWRQRAKYVEGHAKAKTLQDEISNLKKDEGYFHAGKEARIALLEDAVKDGQIVERIARDRKRLHIPFRRIEAIRMNLAKHEERGKKNSIAHMPGYGRINMWCGSLDYELAVGRYVLGTISRRDIADSLRSLADNEDPQDDETLASFDAFMKGPSEEEDAMAARFSATSPWEPKEP